MKKGLRSKAAFLLFFSIVLTLRGFSQVAFTIAGLNYQINEDGVSVTLTGSVDGQGATGELNIPESVNYEGNDYAVTAIGDHAFLYGYYTGSLNIPGSVTSIGDGAFAYCSCFTGDLIIPNSVVSIGYGAFQICFGFTGNLTIPNSVVSIGDFAFNSCDGLKGMLSIPSSVSTIGPDTFSYTAFAGITVDPENSVYDSRDNCNAIIVTSTNELVTGCQSTIIPNTVTTIGYDAFKGCMGLTSIDIPNSVTAIETGAFSFCYGLKGDLTIPNSVTTIGPGAFFYCSSLDGTLTIGESVTFIGDYAFRNCSDFAEAVSLAVTPPELGSEPGWDCVVFEYFGVHTLNVPYGCASAYQNSAWYDPMGWNGFYEFIETEFDAVSEAEDVILAVYPDPTAGVVRIEAEGIGGICIYNISGQKVFEGVASGNAFECDLGKRKSGVYIIVVETPKGTKTKKITII